jgi:hypothetical protein
MSLPIGECPGLTFAEYLADPGLGSGAMRDLLRSPRHFVQNRKPRAESSQALLRGSVIHCAILEGFAALTERYVVGPVGAKRNTKAGREAWAQAESEACGRQIVPHALWEGALAVAEQAASTDAIQTAISGGSSEVSFFAQDPDHPIRLKARADYFNPGFGKGMVLDIKTTRNASPRGFPSSVSQYGYNIQAAHYQAVIEAVRGEKPAFIILAVETSPPYGLALYELDVHWLSTAREDIRRAKQIFVECSTRGQWPAYPARVVTLSMPVWKMSDAAGDAFGTFGDDDPWGDGGDPIDLPGIND